MIFHKKHLSSAKWTSLLAATIVAAFSTGTSQAQISGTVWENIPDASDTDDVAGNTASTLPSATFTVSSSTGLNYNSDITGYNVDTFLNLPASAFINQMNGFDPNGTADNIFVQFTGQVFLLAGNNTFNVEHDDGVNVNINGVTALDDPGPTAAVTSPFTFDNTGPAGDYPFVVDYTECCGPPGVLLWTVNSGVVGVPDGATTLSLLGMSLSALGIIGRRFRK